MLRSRVVLNCTLQVILHFSSLLSALVRLANSTFEIVSDIQRQRWYVSHHLSLSTLYSTLPRSFQGLIDRLAIQSVQDAITHMVYITSILHVAHKCHHSMSDLLSVASSTTSSKRSSSQWCATFTDSGTRATTVTWSSFRNAAPLDPKSRARNHPIFPAKSAFPGSRSTPKKTSLPTKSSVQASCEPEHQFEDALRCLSVLCCERKLG